jgi:hypothetical protein
MTDFNLRRRQVLEVLDEDQRINKRVFEREKEQAKIFNETIAPKAERDYINEANIDSQMDKLYGYLQEVYNNTELLLKAEDAYSRGEGFLNKFLDSFDFSKILMLYNNISRNLNRPDISNTSKSLIKSKIAQYESIVNSIVIGFEKLQSNLESLAADARVAKEAKRAIPRLFSILSFFKTMRKQLYTGIIIPITSRDIQSGVDEEMSKIPVALSNFLNDEKSTPLYKTEIKERKAIIDKIKGELNQKTLSPDETRKYKFLMGEFMHNPHLTTDEIKALEGVYEAQKDFMKSQPIFKPAGPYEERDLSQANKDIKRMQILEKEESIRDEELMIKLGEVKDAYSNLSTNRERRDFITEGGSEILFKILEEEYPIEKVEEFKTFLEGVESAPTGVAETKEFEEADEDIDRMVDIRNEILRRYPDVFSIYLTKKSLSDGIKQLYKMIVYLYKYRGDKVYNVLNRELEDAEEEDRLVAPDVVIPIPNASGTVASASAPELPELSRDVEEGRGRRLRKRRNAMSYNDSRNDPYLIK